MSTDASFLTDDELTTLIAICDTLIPSVEGPEPQDFFRLRGSDLDVPHLVGEAIASLPDPAQHDQFKQLLGLFETRLANLLLTGRFGRFTELPPARREAYLKSWSQSALGPQRRGFQV